MPTVTVKRDLLFEKIGYNMTDEEFDVLCFQFGIELDDIVIDPNDPKGPVQYKLDIPANRYDLLCLEGLSRSLAIFLQKSQIPRFQKITPEKPIEMMVKSSTKNVRPFVVTATLRNVTINEVAYDSLIDLQEKLHHNICRKRALVAIGVHDLDKISPPFIYSAELPGNIRFIPLNQKKEFNALELMDFYQSDTHLKPYLHIIKDEPLYPVIRDSKGLVLSMPPIINGDHSKITLGTKNIFIEATATDQTKAKIVLDILVTMLSEHCKEPFKVETTRVIYEDSNQIQVLPQLEYRIEKLSVKDLNGTIGIDLKAEEMADCLSRMSLKAKALGVDELEVEIPPTRHDIIHACDIVEDLAIAYGYEKIVMTLPKISITATPFNLNKLTDQLREGVAMAGFTEALTFSLVSIEDECEKIRQPREIKEPTLALVANPKTIEFQAVRNTLLPGLLKTIQANKKMPLPLKLFEISDTVKIDPSEEVGTKNERRFCAIYYNKTPGFEVIHGLLDRVLNLLEVKFDPDGLNNKNGGYSLRAVDDPTYFDGRCAEIIYNQTQVIGKLGVLHPEVLENFELNLSASALEITIEPFL